ncbi:hypothetical protein FOC84_09925 [Achromobacter pestifer]|uniref:Uncharacterized protein n=1 Tax=Achromobacter pestifer TaxID=1353889 RepID=A0A7D4DY10_9BURK|nr:hypothetical protein [Achromobacter pestifer]QKH35247.1 hypothetical protein FOC84_09925 [Achromobacter pestifer]
MNVAAISAIHRADAPYPARSAALDAARAFPETQRVAHVQAARAAAAGHAAQAIRERASLSLPLSSFGASNADALRDLHAESRMRRAVEDFTAQPDPAAQRAGSANDLGTIEGLMPLQAYRVAMGNPQVQELQTAVAMKAAGLGIPKVANIGATENVTDNARYRPGHTP